MTYVGNGDQQPPALAASDLGGLAVHGVVKIARIFTINRDQGDIGQVDAVLLVGRPNGIWQGARQRHRLVAEFMRHAIFAHRNFNFHARVVNLAQHFPDPPDRLAEQRRRLGELHHHHLPGFGGAGGAFRNQHVLAVALVFGRNQPNAAFLQQTADDGIR